MSEKCFLCNSLNSVIDFNDTTFKNCSLKLAFRKIKNVKYNDVELHNASLDFVGYHYEYNILYIYVPREYKRVFMLQWRVA